MAFTDPIYIVWFLIEEYLSVIHTSHVPLVCVPCEPCGSANRTPEIVVVRIISGENWSHTTTVTNN